MKKYYIDFILSKDAKFSIELDDPLEVIHCCYWVKIFLVCGNEKRLIGDDVLIYHINILKYQLEKALNNELQMDTSIDEDIGIFYNKYKLGLTKAVFEKTKEGLEMWVGDRYDLLGYGLFTSWIYNDAQGKIRLEFTDIYPGVFIESVPKEDRKNIIPFKQWMQNYKPYLMKEISRAIAQQWLSQIKTLLVTIEANNERDREMYESDDREKWS